jgi:repressor LexA
MIKSLTRKQQDLFEFLVQNQNMFLRPPTLEEICLAIGVKSRGSLHTHIKALSEANLIEPSERKQRGIRLTEYAKTLINSTDNNDRLPFVGTIAAGKPI